MSSDISKWYHSMTFYNARFGYKNTWDDWHLIPSSRPVFSPPKMKTDIIELEGADGVIDLSTALTGFPTYSNREGSFEFIVVNDYGNWKDRYSEIMNYLHGRTMQVVLEDDPDYYYEGLFTVDEWDSQNDGTWSNITINYNVKPYKISNTQTVVTVNSATPMDISDELGMMPVSPLFTVTSEGDGAFLTYTDPLASGSTDSLWLPNGDSAGTSVTLSKYSAPCRVYTETENASIVMTYRNGVL